MVWAEEFGIGEMGLAPAEFWALEPREFWIKHAAFERAEDRTRSLMLQLAALTGQFSKKDQNTLERNANALKRYPLKRWLLPESR